MGIGLHHNTDSLAVVSMASFILGGGTWMILYFLRGSCIIMGNGFIGLALGGGGGGELPLHLPWINPSARQLYAMTIIMCMLTL